MENISYYKKQIIITLLIMIIFLLTILFVYYNTNIKGEKSLVTSTLNIEKKDSNNIDNTSKEDNNEYHVPKEVYVDIKGEVPNPGVYKLSSSSIVNDAIIKAGGLTEKADTLCVNLSKKVKNEMVIYVHSKEEIKKMEDEKEVKLTEKQLCPNIENSSYIKPKEKSDTQVESDNEKENAEIDETVINTDIKININSADIDLLTKLPGIGKSKAQAIISYREKNGNFKKIEDIKNVSGIGDSVFEKIKNSIII